MLKFQLRKWSGAKKVGTAVATKSVIVSEKKLLKILEVRGEKGFRVLPSAEAPLRRYRRVSREASVAAAPQPR
jgi:hypothetical protein